MNSSPGLLSVIHRRLDAVMRPVEVAAAAVGGIMIISAMLLTAADVICRYIFDWPLDFAYYFTENYLMVGMMTMPMAWGFRAGGYIRVVGLARMLPSVLRDPLLRLGLAAGAVYIAALGWLAWGKFVDAYINDSVEMGLIDWPVCWSWIWIPIGCLVFSLRLLVMAIGPAGELHFDHASVAEDPI
jgi:TRAP-type C4-dicarboxylate transport system permease small subunit